MVQLRAPPYPLPGPPPSVAGAAVCQLTPQQIAVSGVHASVGTVLAFYARTFLADADTTQAEIGDAIAAGIDCAIRDLEAAHPDLRPCLIHLLQREGL